MGQDASPVGTTAQPVSGPAPLPEDPALLRSEIERTRLELGAQQGRILGKRRGAAHGLCRRPDWARVLTHRTSSFVVSTACSGMGGVASLTSDRPRSARMPAIAA